MAENMGVGVGGAAASVRVLHVKASLDRRMGGSVTAILNAARSTRIGGDQAAVLATAQDGEDHSLVAELDDAIEVNLIRRTWPRKFGISWHLLQWSRVNLRKYDIVVIHEVFSFPAQIAAYWARRRGVPYIVRPHGSLDPYDLRKHALVKRLLMPLWRAYLTSAAAVWLTADLERDRINMFGATTLRVVSPLPVPHDGVLGDPSRFRRKHGIPSDDFVFLFLGRIDRKKGLERTIDAFSCVSDNGHRWLVIAGTGEAQYEEAIRRRAEASVASDRILFIGFATHTDRADAFSGSDLFVLHSDNENFGLAPVEALHYGLPSLLSDEVYVSRELERLGVAVVVSVSEPGQLIDAIRSYGRRDDPRILALRQRARASVETFSLEAIAAWEHDIVVDALKIGSHN